MASFPTAMPASTRFFDAGITALYFLPTIAATTLIPTRAEITAGKSLAKEISDIAGWQVNGNEITTPALGSRYDAKIPGKVTTDDSSITFYMSQDGVDVRTILPRDTAGYILIADGGDVAGQPCDVFKVRVRANGKMRSTGEDAARIMVPFSILAFAEDVTLPTNP